MSGVTSSAAALAIRLIIGAIVPPTDDVKALALQVSSQSLPWLASNTSKYTLVSYLLENRIDEIQHCG